MLRLAPLRVVLWLWCLLYCGVLIPCALACGTLCICYVGVLCWHGRSHAILFFCCVVLTQSVVLCRVVWLLRVRGLSCSTVVRFVRVVMCCVVLRLVCCVSLCFAALCRARCGMLRAASCLVVCCVVFCCVVFSPS